MIINAAQQEENLLHRLRHRKTEKEEDMAAICGHIKSHAERPLPPPSINVQLSSI